MTLVPCRSRAAASDRPGVRREDAPGLAQDAGLDATGFVRDLEGGLERQEVLDDYRVALETYGNMALGIPLMVVNKGYPLVGALPLEMYRRVVQRAPAGPGHGLEQQD